MRRKPASATSSAAAPHRSTILPLRQRFTRRVQAAVREKQLSLRLVEERLRRSSSYWSSQWSVSVSSSPSCRLRAAYGPMASSHFRSARSFFKASWGVGFGPRAAQPPSGLLLFFLGQMFRHVVQLVNAAALDQSLLGYVILKLQVCGRVRVNYAGG